MPEVSNTKWLDAVLARNPDFAFRQIEDEAILLPIRANVTEDNRLYALNPTGVRVWELIDGKRTGKEIRNILTEEFEIEAGHLTKDVGIFVLMLANVGGIQMGENR